jgi:hypothetical protein
MTLPNIWGKGGQLFAFSGMDGETDVLTQLVGSSLEKGRGFLFHLDPPVTISVAVSGVDDFESATDQVICGDAVSSTVDIGGNRIEISWAFYDRGTLLVQVSALNIAGCVPVELRVSSPQAEVETSENVLSVVTPNWAMSAVASPGMAGQSEPELTAMLCSSGDSALFSLGYGINAEEASKRAQLGTNVDFDTLFAERMTFFDSLQIPQGTESEQRMYAKCASVMKVNCVSAQGMTEFPWTTPDRWPHVHMWIWDSGFHALGLRHFAPGWAENAIKAVLCRQHENGFIPHTMKVNGESDIIQPPILAWCGWEVYETTRNREFIEYCYPRLVKMIEFDLRERDSDGSGLAEWDEGGASGMDNSPRFDGPIGDAVDLNSFIVNEMRYLSLMAALLERPDEAEVWRERGDKLAELTNKTLWDDETGFYYDNDPGGNLIKIKAESAFTPMFAGICSNEQARRLVDHLTNPNEFWRALPVASVSADEPTFCDNMWRGPVWINYNYFIIQGLIRYGYKDIAEDLRKRTLDEIVRWYEEDGVTYEFYDSEAATSPIYLHRKTRGGPAVQRLTMLGTTICDYNWTAALYLELLWLRQEGR